MVPVHKITISFDNGPDPEITPQVLDVLRRREIKSTFFVIGEKLRDAERRRVCERAYNEGHWIGNHTFNHLVPLGLGRAKDVHLTEIARAQELLRDLAHPAKLFRPFSGGGGGRLDETLLNRMSFDYLVSEGFTCVLWNVVPRDWEYPHDWVEMAVRACLDKQCAVVVLHDLPTGAMAHLDEFIEEMQERGARFEQDFPPDCVPLLRGKVVLPMDKYISF